MSGLPLAEHVFEPMPGFFRSAPTASPPRRPGKAGGRVAVSMVVLTAALLFAAEPAPADAFPVAVLRTLDKVTARVMVLKAPLHQVMQVGTLEIVARSCDKRPPEETPESAAFLEIWEVRPGKPVKSVFTGWMFASTPGLSALEHPIYDVWVLDCVSSSESAADSSAGAKSP